MTLKTLVVCLLATTMLTSTADSSAAADWFVAAGRTGTGTSAAPFGRIQDALAKAQAGDTIHVGPGTYAESLVTVRGGMPNAPIRIRAQGTRGSSIVTMRGRVLQVNHPYVTVEGFVFDGQYGLADTVDVNDGADFLTLRNLEVRRSSKDLIDIGSPEGVAIEGCLIHHALNAANGRTDAHGIVASAVQGLTIRDTEVHTFSGDAFQVDPGRLSPGWNRVLIERAKFWLEPLPAPANGFAAGVVPGENAVDTKAGASLPRGTIEIRDTVAWGFRNGLIANMAAFNLKENVSVVADRVTVYDSQIAFRLRGPTGSPYGGANVTIANAVVHDTSTAFRYEGDPLVAIWNSTIGLNVVRPFEAASSGSAGIDVRNVAMIAAKPAVASEPSNLSVAASAFVNAAAHNYMLAPGSPAIDAGASLSTVKTDRDGAPRPQGLGHDVGAYEAAQTQGAPAPVAGSDDVVAYAAKASAMSGEWRVIADRTAAAGSRIWHPNAGARALPPQSIPLHYFEITAWVEAGRPYRLWLRGKADGNYHLNDAVHVQFSAAIDAKGAPAFRIGTTSAATVQISECSACGLDAWGWQDNAAGRDALGPTIQFAKTGFQTIRIQTMDDGLSIDQIVLSPSTYLSKSPGLKKADNTILPES